MITLIAAMNEKRTLGLNGKMPWHNPEELQHFKNYTMHKTVLMGRKTYEGLPKKLVGRNILIVSRNKKYEDGVTDLNEFLKNYQNTEEELIVAGGGEIYNKSLKYADKIVLSIILKNDVVGDTFFPEIDEDLFEIKKIEKFETFKCITYIRKRK